MEIDGSECPVCNQTYSDNQAPRNLGCGHSVCTSCLDLLIPISKNCPECRRSFRENKAAEFPINYPLLRLSRLFLYTQTDASALPAVRLPLKFPASKTQPNAGKCPSHGCSLFYMCLRCGVPVCHECLISDHPDPPMGLCCIMSIEEAITTIKTSVSKSTEELTKDANTTRSKLEKEIRVLNMSLEIMKSRKRSGDSVELCKNIEDLERQHKVVQVRSSILDCMTNNLKEMKGRLKNVLSYEEINRLQKESTECLSAYDEFKEEEKRRQVPNVIDFLIDGKKDIKELVDAGKPVFAITEEKEETSRWASITSQNDRIHLHSLQKGTPPEDGVVLPYEVVRDLIPKESPTIFLEVAWEGESKGHVYVRMYGDTPRSRQTVLLCSGVRGPSYRNTCFYQYLNQTDGFEILSGGDYENNDGSGGRALVEGIVSGHPYHHEVKAGLFVSWPASERWHLGAFDIYLRDTPDLYDYSAHGMVEQGLDILRQVSQVEPVTGASVIECGLIIPV